MEVRYALMYHPAVFRLDIPSLGHVERNMIADVIAHKLQTSPEIFGKPLKKSLKGCRSLRVSDYRVVFFLKGQIVHIVAIEHRSASYREAEKRFG